jgi:CO/xanthine dehydrogenase FAD-binding subunit
MIGVKENLSATNLDGIFAGGDVTGRSATVVHGMASGKNAATAIDSYLSGKGIAPSTAASGKARLNINAAALKTSLPGNTPELSISQRKLNSEDKQTLSSEAFASEAKRCANCGCVAVNASDLATALITLDAEVKTTTRTLKAEDLFAATMNSSTVLAEDELIEEFLIPTPNPASRQSYHKFRIRNSIDFPIISVAFCATIESGRMHNVRMVLGAVAPIPLRMRAVEQLLEGQAPDAAIAAKAAELATKDAQPLARNKAKVEILKALINRAIQTG